MIPFGALASRNRVPYMSTTLIIVATLLLFSGFAVRYVYAVRGQERYHSFKEYLRKGWPLFTPFNCLLYLFTEKRARPAIMDLQLFPELSLLQEHWQVISEEATHLQKSDVFNSINNPTTAAHYDVGFRTFYKYGWRKFYLKWYGYNHQSARNLCPRTVEILNRIPSINGAMFSILPPNSQLTRHLDPVACSLRYHLGLQTPNTDKCFISVDGQVYSWRNGEALLFDETFIHFVRNDTDEYRLILMCDVERPMNIFGKAFNFLYKRLMKGTIVPNTEIDKSGWISTLFRKITPIMEYGQQLKRSNRSLYKLIAYGINATLLLILFLSIGSLISMLRSLF